MKNIEIKKIKNSKKIDFLYLGVLLLLFIITIIIFIISKNIISKNINKIFNENVKIDSHYLNLERYNLLEKKLHLPVSTKNNIAPVINTKIKPENSLIISEITDKNKSFIKPEIIIPMLNKKILTINILNSTNKNGAASTLSNLFKNDGYSNIKTGNTKNAYKKTTILIKKNKKQYIDLIKKTVKTHYNNIVIKTNPTKSDFDVIIIIGKK